MDGDIKYQVKARSLGGSTWTSVSEFDNPIDAVAATLNSGKEYRYSELMVFENHVPIWQTLSTP